MQRILWGFFKKLVIADRILVGVNTIIEDPGTYRGAWVFVGMVFYALELLADLSGGIDITIGILRRWAFGWRRTSSAPIFLRISKILEPMAHHYGKLVYRLYFLSDFRL